MTTGIDCFGQRYNYNSDDKKNIVRENETGIPTNTSDRQREIWLMLREVLEILNYKEKTE